MNHSFTPALPPSRGPLSGLLVDALRRRPDQLSASDADLLVALAGASGELTAPEAVEDVQLALWVLFELHYRGFAGVDADWEWDPRLLSARRHLEDSLLESLRRRLAQPIERFQRRLVREGPAAAVDDAFEQQPGPALARFIRRTADIEQWREFLACRSVYQLKEADPHSWAIPRLHGRAQSALLDIQYDEYGTGRPERKHATLFADTLTGSGLSADYGHYVAHVPAEVLAASNFMSTCGLRRSLRGASVGHLAMYESSSCQPNRDYDRGAARLGFGEDVRAYFLEHVEADAVHEQVALRHMLGGLLADEPSLLSSVALGVVGGIHLDNAVARRQLSAWKSGESCLTSPLTQPVAA
ncbi:iron-containing redox enzyme family protein [Nocardioides rotundus]|uniref:iron-containing redox enzyme family protein n=1 Tax=Nocardioides rotundus TaxID=1774216 RepID=UPI001CBD6A10|nr:iron-containing redox enzyme family protein [Nocardioides rotundus]UAL30104.1 iron-containing redox enzyme family protein [Nocardioides rotundus]